MTMDLTTSFHILELDPQADPDTAKRAYKAMVRRWHPDQFPEGSPTQRQAEEQLKRINIAYARIREHFRLTHRAAPDRQAPQAPSTAPSGQTSQKRSWVDHLFDRLNAFADNQASGSPSSDPEPSPGGRPHKNFQQVLGEMAGDTLATGRKPARGASAPFTRTATRRRRGGSVDAVEGTDRIAPIRPVSRVRGIGRNH
jgi:curved DNA-binding protein CbpA